MQKSRKRVGLALGSGGMRGMAHIGVLQVLEESGIPIDLISGASLCSHIIKICSLFCIKKFSII